MKGDYVAYWHEVYTGSWITEKKQSQMRTYASRKGTKYQEQ